MQDTNTPVAPAAKAAPDTSLLLTRKEAADRLRKSTRTLDRYIAEGIIKPVQFSERTVLFRTADIAAFVDRVAEDAVFAQHVQTLAKERSPEQRARVAA